MKHFITFFIFIGFVGVAQAELDSSILEPFSSNDIVVIGTVIQIIEDNGNTQYDIKVEEFLKGQLSFDLITVTLNQVRPSDFPQDLLDYYNKPFFEKGNQVLAYLKQEGGTFEMSPYSFTIKKPSVAGPPTVIHPTGPQEHINSQGDEIIISGTIKKGYLYGLAKSDLNSDFNLVVLNENEKQVESKKLTILPDGSYSFSFQGDGELRLPGKYSWEITYENGGMGGEFFVTVDLDSWTPLKQFKSGVSISEIQCKETLLLIKKYDGTPACVTSETKEKLIERGWIAKDGSMLKTSTNCMTLAQNKETAPFFKTPTYLPEGYSHVCSQSGTPSESYIVYHHQEILNWNIPELVSDGAIFLYQIDERNIVGAEKLETLGTAEQRIQETYDSVMNANPSLQPQLIKINGMLAYAVDSCPDCGMQTANFADGTFVQKSTSTETKIKFIDENGTNYMLKTTLPLDELILVAESLQ